MTNNEEFNDQFTKACETGNLDTVKHLLTEELADIHTRDDLGVRIACMKGHLEIVQYLLTSPELTEHANIHALNDTGFYCACAFGETPVIQYLLTSPDLIPYGHTPFSLEIIQTGFMAACEAGAIDVVHYLIVEGDITTTPEITEYLTTPGNRNKVNSDEVFKLLNRKDIYSKLGNDLTKNPNAATSRLKI